MENARFLIRKLQESGHEAYLVGGCVRDMLMGAVPHDFDITTSATPDEMLEVFSDFKVIPTGLKHGTVTVLICGEPYEITTYRCDGEYSDHRRPERVTFSARLEDDLARRDFTVNAMAYNDRDGIIDLFGGREDIKNGIIRAVGNPRERFNEDALRILRALRFASEKNFIVEAETGRAIFEGIPLLAYVSAERIFSELKRLLMGEGVFRVLDEFSAVMGAIVPPLAPCIGFDQNNYHHIYDVYTHTAHAVALCPKDATVRLAALLHDVGKPCTYSVSDGVGHFYGHPAKSVELAREALNALKSDNETKDTVLSLIKYHDHVIEVSEKAVRRMLGKLGKERLLMLLELKTADNLAQAPEYHGRVKQYEQIRAIMDAVLAKDDCFSLAALAVRGGDIIALGVPKGREVGRILDELLALVIDGELPNEKSALLEKARELM